MPQKVKSYLRYLASRYDVRSFIFLEVAVGIVLSVFVLFLFLYISDAVLDHQTIYLDNSISRYIYSLRQPWLTTLMSSISMLGEQILFFQAVILVVLLTIKRHRKEALIFSILLAMGLIISTLLKISLKIPRPEGFALVKINSYSFPSYHALNSFLFYGTLSYFAFHFTKSKSTSFFVILISIIIVFLVGVSRVYLGVHRPSDVLAGDIAGFWLLVTVILIDKTIIYYKLVKESKNT